MNIVRALLVAAALLTAACGAAAGSSGSAGLRDATTVGTVRVSKAANAGSESDVNRNLAITKGTRPALVTQAQPPAAAPKSVEPPVPLDRCNGGVWTGHEGGNRSSTGSATHPPLPACAMQ